MVMRRTDKPRQEAVRHESPRIAWAIGLTRAAMLWEQVARAFWPVMALIAVTGAALAFGVAQALPRIALLISVAVILLAVLLALVWGLRRFHRPSRQAALARVDAALPGKPLSALRDHVVLGQDDPGAMALWQAHRRRMQAVAAQALAIGPDADLPRRDPFALRLAAGTALVMALLFAPADRLGQGIAALGAGFRPLPQDAATVLTGPGWEGWVQPPAYTRRPVIYLNALSEGEGLTLPKGSTISFRLYGQDAQVHQNIGEAVAESDPAAPRFIATQDGELTVAGRRFPITVTPDAAPTVSPGTAPTRRADGRLIQQFSAQDDHGVEAGLAVISLDLEAVDRRFGLEPAPEARPDLELALPLPATGQRKDVRGQLVADLARHPWANLPVTIRLQATDGIQQIGQSAPMQMILPGRRFFDPLAAALIELRRDLLWSHQNRQRSAQVLRTVVWQPEGFMDADLAAGLRGAIARLESGPLDEKSLENMAEMLWSAAVELEDGGLSDALERMRQAQERLSEAIRNGASEDEIRRLMDELREATDAYTDMLVEQGEAPEERFDRSPRDQRQQITGSQIQEMMDEIQRLMNEGRMAEAQELLEQFNRMMENLKASEGTEQGDGAGQRPMNRLADTLREQQRLSDDAMRELQDQFMEGGPNGGSSGQQPQPPQAEQQDPSQDQPGSDAEDGDEQPRGLAERQRDLREELGRQRGLLPGQGSTQGDEAARRLDEAGRAMEQAEQALRDGDMAGAMEDQAQAIQSMREGLRALGDLMAQDGNRDQSGQQDGQSQPGMEGPASDPNGQRGMALPYAQQPALDPLGRSMMGQGNSLSGGDPLSDAPDPGRQARNLLDEIRRRLGERQRPAEERDYLDRLLDRF